MSQFQWTIQETRPDGAAPDNGETGPDTIPELKLHRRHGAATEAVAATINLQSAQGVYGTVVKLTTGYSSESKLAKAAATFRDNGWTAGVAHRPNPLQMILTLRKPGFSNLEIAVSETEAVVAGLEKNFMTAAAHLNEMRQFAAAMQPAQ